MAPCCRHRVSDFCSFDPLGCRFKRPSNYQRDWKSNCDQYDHQPHNPIWNFEERKYLRRDLSDYPADNGVRDRNFVNIAPLKLGEEILRIHCSGLAIGFKSMSKEKTAEWRGGHEPFRQTRQL